ncbi:YbaY family lipoprotein [Pseudomonas gingeri]|uniref:YbaY family lipoprotein n=1 Tax=Pseudomonas gingeri TaxID=117681 RepID=UPI0015A39DF4|nr:YbaY family lipoprotein [Pseudomonas gingeri]NWA02904.1 YbaY family lipoprotein [Pseudomonas gingeri]NWA17067.1 YbaY family lipoprotein [Pseudomonas gingeri]NWA58518.1 YbaY family lipoprotein [Pseudomonas gingeri]NWA97912.1 YbaY family lipoprotein [Pseudomonas gingeri]NWB06004.1 YbaY family lipoprotein [Pseudomonas gingeri]
MSVRPLVLLSLAGLLVACSSAPKPVPAPAPQVQTKKPVSPYEELGPLPAFQRELSGTLLGVPANAEVELALLVIDERGRPQQLLASSKINGTGQALPFRLRFNPEVFPAGSRVELRGRASQSGQLILHLPSVSVTEPTTQAMGQLQFVSAP